MCSPPHSYEDVDVIEALTPPSTEAYSETSLQDEQLHVELRDAARERSTLVALDLYTGCYFREEAHRASTDVSTSMHLTRL